MSTETLKAEDMTLSHLRLPASLARDLRDYVEALASETGEPQSIGIVMARVMRLGMQVESERRQK